MLALSATGRRSGRPRVRRRSEPADARHHRPVHKIAKLSATVLILGESGTGKELFRNDRFTGKLANQMPFIAVNSAAIPKELVESTLRSRERRVLTGALRQQLGKFELPQMARCSTKSATFVSTLQSKLLRAIQEGEIERVGGEKPIKTSFRLIAATNVDPEKAVKEGRFREDLYYRVNVILPRCRHCASARKTSAARRVLPAALQRLLPKEHRRHHRADDGHAEEVLGGREKHPELKI